jgi:C1A family cysteine protease
MPSRLFIYCNERAKEGTASSDGKNGMMPLPASNEQVVGGHAVMVVGYNDAKQVFVIRNSWGASWADKGYFYMPYAFITSNNCSDFWTLKIVKI